MDDSTVSVGFSDDGRICIVVVSTDGTSLTWLGDPADAKALFTAGLMLCGHAASDDE